MPSILKVDEISNPSTGKTVIDTKSALEIDCFYVNADIENSASAGSGVIIHQWARANISSNSISIGNFPTGVGLTGPSGSGDSVNCFSFPKPGYYQIDLTWVHFSRNDNPYSGLLPLVSIDNGANYEPIGVVISGHTNASHAAFHTSSAMFFLNVESVTGSNAVKLRIQYYRYYGNSSNLDMVVGTHSVSSATTSSSNVALKSYLYSQRIGEAVTL